MSCRWRASFASAQGGHVSYPLGLSLGSGNCLTVLPVFKSSLPPIPCEQASPVGCRERMCSQDKGGHFYRGMCWAAWLLGDERVAHRHCGPDGLSNRPAGEASAAWSLRRQE